MQTGIVMGVSAVSIGAILGGTFALPSKYSGSAPWEVLWGLFFLHATLVIPCIVFFCYGRELLASWSACSGPQLATPILFGFLWGLGSFVSGLAFSIAGLSLAYALTMGMQQSFGPAIPLLTNYQHTSPQAVLFVVLGIVACLIGVFFCGYAGIIKDRLLVQSSVSVTSHHSLRSYQGIVLAVVGGALASCLNFAFSYGSPVMSTALAQFGNNPAGASLAVWILALAGGSISTLGYCVFRLLRNRAARQLRTEPMKNILFLAVIMAILHDGAIFFYGLGANQLGTLGTSVGFGIFASGMMLVGNANGFVTGEWKGTERRPRCLLFVGLCALVCGIVLLGYANSLNQS